MKRNEISIDQIYAIFNCALVNSNNMYKRLYHYGIIIIYISFYPIIYDNHFLYYKFLRYLRTQKCKLATKCPAKGLLNVVQHFDKGQVEYYYLLGKRNN